jgi:hypothetical protein
MGNSLEFSGAGGVYHSMRATVITVAMLSLLSGCDNAPLKVYTPGGATPLQRAAMREASDLLGHELVHVSSPYGAVTMDWWDAPVGGLNGWTDQIQWGCTRKVASIARGSTLAHEIGHAFRLRHVDDEEDLMFEDGDADRSYFGEQDDLSRRINNFAACRP